MAMHLVAISLISMKPDKTGGSEVAWKASALTTALQTTCLSRQTAAERCKTSGS